MQLREHERINSACRPPIPIKVSIGIPTYNGSETIKETLNCLINQHQEGVELILCDDNSTDNTFEIISEYEAKHSFVRSFRNEKNLGMDANFRQTALHATGEYLWFFGQDDLMHPGCVSHVLSTLNQNEDVSIVYINYSQHSHTMDRVIIESYLEGITLKNQTITSDLKFSKAQDYFSLLEDLPSFLPATITKQKYWTTTNLTPFFGTAYIQMGLMYLNLDKGSIFVISTPYIRGRIPLNQWQSDGKKHFNVLTGALKMYGIVRKKTGYPPARTFRKRHLKYLLNYLYHVRLCKTLGLKASDTEKSLLIDVYGNGLLYKCYLLPLLVLPVQALTLLSCALFPLKWIARRFNFLG